MRAGAFILYVGNWLQCACKASSIPATSLRIVAKYLVGTDIQIKHADSHVVDGEAKLVGLYKLPARKVRQQTRLPSAACDTMPLRASTLASPLDNSKEYLMILTQERCQAKVDALEPADITLLQVHTPGWHLDGGKLVKTFHFANYHETLAFVNASAWISHHEDHHPELTVTYNACRVAYDTHSVNGLSRNDFICAAKLEALF